MLLALCISLTVIIWPVSYTLAYSMGVASADPLAQQDQDAGTWPVPGYMG